MYAARPGLAILVIFRLKSNILMWLALLPPPPPTHTHTHTPTPPPPTPPPSVVFPSWNKIPFRLSKFWSYTLCDKKQKQTTTTQNTRPWSPKRQTNQPQPLSTHNTFTLVVTVVYCCKLYNWNKNTSHTHAHAPPPPPPPPPPQQH